MARTPTGQTCLARRTVNRKVFGYSLWIVSLIISIAWLAESITRGRGFISTYLAPVAITGNVAAVFLIRSGKD